MIPTLSTKSKVQKSEKHLNSARFLKKDPTDENQKNIQNCLEKTKENKLDCISNKLNKGKKKISQMNISIRSGKTLKGLGSINLSTKNIKNEGLEKEKSYKEIKVTESAEFPKILIKSISQTSMNRKLTERNFKILEKIGKMQKKQAKNEKSFSKLKKQMQINNFKLGKKLGNGRFGNVYLAEEKVTKTLYAIKIMNKIKIKQEKMEDQIMSEIKLQLYMNHPNILKLYGFFHDSKNIYLILEYCSQCLFREFRVKGALPQQQTAFYCKQAISALKFMHNQYIMHRDIKPQNILIQNGVIKLSDFGWSIYSPLYKRKTFCGTMDYVSPEIVQGASYDERVDIWALGVLLYQLNSGKAPFQTQNQKVTYDLILHSECRFPQHFSSELTQLVKKILDKDPKQRPNLDQIERNEWFEKYKTTGRYISKEIWNAWNNL